MSYGRMSRTLSIIRSTREADDEGFMRSTLSVIKTVRCYREGRHGSIRWANLATFSEATDLFRIRVIPKLDISTDYILECDGERYKPLSVENVRGRGMYVEILAKRIVSTDGEG